MANPYETNAREHKAQAIVGVLWQAMTPGQRRDPRQPERVRLFNQTQRDLAAGVAGKHTPSRDTWARVVELLGERHRQEVSAPGFPKPCNVEGCDGGTLTWRTCHHSGACPCDYGEGECSTCDGTGLLACTDCGQHPATRLNEDGEETCETCAVPAGVR